MSRKASLVGLVFGKLTVISRAPAKTFPSGQVQHCFNCQCSCGNTTVVRHSHLRSGYTKSCGCGIASIISAYGRPSKDRTYRAWQSMLDRCLNFHCTGYENYGGRGIKVCNRWNDFGNFLSDMGECPKGLFIERVNNDLGYGPDNCIWTTRKEQNRNTRRNRILTIHGVTGCIAMLCEHFGQSLGLVNQRLHYGWAAEKAFFHPKRQRAPKAASL